MKSLSLVTSKSLKLSLSKLAPIFSPAFIIFTSGAAFAGPLVSSGGFAQLIASCETPTLAISVVSYDGILKANVHTKDPGGYGVNLLSTTVSETNAKTTNGVEFASAPNSHPAFDLIVSTPANSKGEYEAFMLAELQGSSVATSQPAKCFILQSPLK